MRELMIVGGGFAGTWAAMSAAATRFAHSEEKMGISVVSQLDSLCGVCSGWAHILLTGEYRWSKKR